MMLTTYENLSFLTIFTTSLMKTKCQVVNQLFYIVSKIWSKYIYLCKISGPCFAILCLMKFKLKKWLTTYIFVVNEVVKMVNDTTQILCCENHHLYF